MDTRRLRFVNDLSPLLGCEPLSHEATHWNAAISPSVAPAALHTDGFTVMVMNNRFITWHRTFTNGVTPPAPMPSRALIRVHEWAPMHWPRAHHGWKHFGPPDCLAIYRFADGVDYRTRWSDHARRHLKQFKKSGATLELGTIDDAAAVFAHSQVPKHLHGVFLRLAEKHLATHPRDVEFLVARLDGKPIAVFMALNCDEVKQSYYLSGGFDTRYPKAQALTGLIDWWYARSLARGYATVNFGGMDSSKQWPLISAGGQGYSIFKTHFGIRRVWMPGSFWKFSFANFSKKLST